MREHVTLNPIKTFWPSFNPFLPTGPFSRKAGVIFLLQKNIRIYSRGSQTVLFKHLIIFYINKRLPLPGNPSGIWMKLSITLHCILTLSPRWWCILTLSLLFSFHTLKHQWNVSTRCHSAYGSKEYLTDIIISYKPRNWKKPVKTGSPFNLHNIISKHLVVWLTSHVFNFYSNLICNNNTIFLHNPIKDSQSCFTLWTTHESISVVNVHTWLKKEKTTI